MAAKVASFAQVEAPKEELAVALAEQGVPSEEFRCLDFGVPWCAE